MTLSNFVGVVAGTLVIGLGVAILVFRRWAFDFVKRDMRRLFGATVAAPGRLWMLVLGGIGAVVLGTLMVALGATGSFA